MDNLLFRFAMLLWITGIIFYCALFPIVTKKCFWKKTSLKKNICNVVVCVLLMPMLVYEYSYALSMFLVDSFHISELSVGGIILLIFCDIAFNLLAAYLYVLYFKPVNKAIAIFVYFMVSIITYIPSSLPPMNAKNATIGDTVQILGESILILALGYMFYHFLIVPVSKITHIDNKIGRRAFIILPAFSLVYTEIIAIINLLYADNDILIVVIGISSVFVILVVCIGFYYIIQNTIVINELEKARDEVKTLSVEVMEALAHTIDAKDEYTKGHSVRVAKYSRMIAEKMGLSAENCENVYYMGLLHDIGKIGVPNEIINKPTKLSDEEYSIIKLHPVIGYDILIEIKSKPELSIGALWHHERYDGKGYPDGKSRDEIPYLARIITVADSYDAMTSNRSYRKYLSQEAVREELEKNMGTQFDPEVAKCMIALIDDDTEYVMHEPQ
ncbi:MAG: HD-GYP domain-containing protein [Lachnospiraceae bacterium]|nr:HD-GYP domain-containing protein [Lachnospiraceae bacterium]MDY4618168.1 HD-GYP domain-containing protein [Lachnospiraceae bacterium]